MKYIFLIIILFSQVAIAQPKKTDKKLITNLEDHIEFLADDKLEGRRTGSNGEKLASEYIIKEFKKTGLSTFASHLDYLQTFEINDGKELSPLNSFTIFSKALIINKDYFPLSYSANKKAELIDGNTNYGELFDIGPVLSANTTNPHFDLNAAIIEKAKSASKEGKRALLVYNSSEIKDNLRFDSKDKTLSTEIPVVYLTGNTATFLKTENSEYKKGIQLQVEITSKKRTGRNVIGFIDNKAPITVVIGAHYDHLGYGEDQNSLYTGSTKQIHNGADDNASGTAALIELARLVKKSSLKKNNYLFIAFSGEELGLFGSKYFVDNYPTPLIPINYMINMDMIGRLSDSRGLNIGGYGTSPSWKDLVSATNEDLKIKFDSSGSGPSDHTSFYRKEIPVLFFFTGSHKDYHKPTDDFDNINFEGEANIINLISTIIENADSKGKLAFTKTKEPVMTGKSSFKVSLGIMPDYTYSGSGVLAEGVSEGRPAQKAGIKAGDVLIQLGDHKFTDVQSYMSALNQFNKGESTKVKVMRDGKEYVFDITF